MAGNEDYLKINKVGTPVENISPVTNYSTTQAPPIMDPENNPTTPGRTAKTEGGLSRKLLTFDTQNKYINNGITQSHEAAKNFSFAKEIAGGEGTNSIAFGQLTASIGRGEGMGNLNQIGSIYNSDGSMIERAKNLHLIG